MKKITISIETRNAAFEDGVGYEAARILRELIWELEREQARTKTLYDSNGNNCGKVTIKE